MRIFSILLVCLLLICCKNDNKSLEEEQDKEIEESPSILKISAEHIELTLYQANKLAQLPLSCINLEYPNKLNQILSGEQDIREPSELHPAFYGCFDWHSSVHGHWALVSLLKKFPDLHKKEDIIKSLRENLSENNILTEVAYFKKEHNKSFERTYGWAWLLKLAEELHSWDDPLGEELETNLRPLTNLIEQNFRDFLPKLRYPIRVGEHSNSAFALSFAYDYALTFEKMDFLELIEKTARNFYVRDDNCPLEWEPSGFDFLSPCFSEIDIMRRVLSKNAFAMWMEDFMPNLKNKDFAIEVGEVADRQDGKLVHLDGLNYNRAWVMFNLANQYPTDYGHLKEIAWEHMQYSFPNLFGDNYEGGHWLGTFALYALNSSINNR